MFEIDFEDPQDLEKVRPVGRSKQLDLAMDKSFAHSGRASMRLGVTDPGGAQQINPSAKFRSSVSEKARARDAAKSCLELGSQKAPSTHQRCCDTACTQSVTTYCGACNVTTACLPLCATYGEGRSEHRASQAQDGHSKRQLYRKGLLGDGWCCSHRQRGIKAGSNKIFPVLSKGDETPQAVLEDS